MPKAVVETVDAYIAAQPQAVQSALKTVRSAIRRALPDALETISYSMPAYKIDGIAIVYFAAWKNHYSLYPIGDEILAAAGAQLQRYAIKKSALHLSYDEPVPESLIELIATVRLRLTSESARRVRSERHD